MIAARLAPELLAEIYAHARAAFPAECCGYVIDDRVVRCTNAQDTGANPIAPERGADTGFVIAGRDLYDFARAFAAPAPPRVVYHSHTNGRAYFSDVDRAASTTEAGPTYPVQHLVIGVTSEGITECAQFAWDGGAFVEVARWC
jgi:proteasome lid subunit RPN8/RPN11